MNILFVHEKVGWFGGVEQNVADAAALRSRGHACFLAHGGQEARDVGGYAALFDGVAGCHEVGDSAGASFSDVVSRFRPDVLYFHKVPAVRSFLDCGARMVRMVHDHDLTCPRSHKYFMATGRVCTVAAGWHCMLDGAFLARDRSAPLGVRFVDVGARLRELGDNRALHAVIVASRFMRDQLVGNGFSSDRVRVVAPAVRIGGERLPASEAREVLYVGQLIRGKGVDLLLQAAARLRGEFRLTVIGDGNARASLEVQAARLDVPARFVGWVPQAELSSWYQRARVTVVPSRWPEPYGLVGLEAMSFARPVVAFNVGGIADWLVDGETGFLVPEQDVSLFAAAVQRLLDDPERASRMGLAGYERVQASYSFERYLDALESVLAG